MNAITMIWNRVSETGLPKTEPNTDTEFIVAVHRRAQDRVDVFAASFLNAKQLYSADELGEIAHDEGTKPVTGWYILTADDPNQDACWWNIIDDGSGDAVVAWMAMPPEPIFFVGSKGRCTVCNDTGRSILPNGDQSTYLDCRHCGAAEERVSMNEAVGAFAMINRDDMDCNWFIHQRARQIEREASATRIAELEAQIAAASAPVVEQQPVAWVIYADVYGEMIIQDAMYFKKDRAEADAKCYGQNITEVRALYAAPMPVIAEKDLWALLQNSSWYLDPPDGGNVSLLEQLQRMSRDAAAYRFTALQAPVREVRKQRHVYDWLHLVETKIGTPTAASAARVLKEFYEGAEPDEPLPAAPVQKGGE